MVTVSETTTPRFETAFTMEGSSIKFGPGVTAEVGYDLKSFGSRRAMVVVDPNLVDSETLSITLSSLHEEGIDTAVFDQVRVEPTDVSLKEAIAFAVEGRFDGYVAVGGGSTIDTCKVANLFATYPADFMEYVNAPIGKGTPGARTAGSHDRHPHHGRHRAARPPAWPSSTWPPCTPRRVSRTARSGRGWASSTPTTPARCRAWWWPAPAWTSSATLWSR